jgi:hypothetical protein
VIVTRIVEFGWNRVVSHVTVGAATVQLGPVPVEPAMIAAVAVMLAASSPVVPSTTDM